MSAPILVETAEGLAHLRGLLERSPFACFDAEGPGQGAFPDRLCLLVLSVGGEVFVVDPFEIDVRDLGVEFARVDRPLVVHDVAYDARLFALSGLTLGYVHDTAVAATMLGKAKTGLASLAEELLGVTVDKSLQASAWARRPLDSRAMRYLAGDAELPLELHARLWPALEEADLVDEVLTETQYRIRKAADAVVDGRMPAWWKLPVARGLREPERRWLRSAWIARDRLARRRDRAPSLFLKDEELEILAKEVPSDPDDLRYRLGRREKDSALVAALVDAFELRATPIPAEESAKLDTPVPSSGERERLKKRRKKLTDWRAQEAKERGVGEIAILPGHLADRLSASPPRLREELEAFSGMGQRRAARYGDALLALLEDR